jgi:hypothetical protein
VKSADLPFSLAPVLSLGVAVAILTGCQSFGGYAGAVGGVAAAGASANPAVGIGVGIAIRAGADALLDAVFRHMQTGEQDRIAAQASTLAVGQRVAWQAKQIWPLPSEEGDMQVVADIDNPLSPCRVVLFSVLTKKQRAAQKTATPTAASDASVTPDASASASAGVDGNTAEGIKASTTSVQWFQTSVCRRSDGKWKWAQAEPATERWGNLQ